MSQLHKPIQRHQIQQIIQICHINRLSQINQHSTLQYQPPNTTFNNPIKLHKYKEEFDFDKNFDSSINLSNMVFSNNDQFNKKVCINIKDSFQCRKNQQSKIHFYSVIKMLFSEVNGVPPLAIDVMDTMFYNSDGSITYVYSDLKRGLIKTKSKNYIQMFLKRKTQVDRLQQNNISKNQIRSNEANEQHTDSLNTYEKKYQYLRRFKYVALLRYKDQNFIRLKQSQFKQIFIRPVQANQKYKIWNNTSYIQLIPQQVNYEQQTLFNIQFALQKFKNTIFFKKVVHRHCQQTSFENQRESKTTKQWLKQINTQIYLLYLIIEIYSYVSVHYHKQICFGVFQFMKVRDTFYLSNATKIKLNQSDNLKNQYARSDLFQQFVNLQINNQYKQKQSMNGVTNALSQIFDKQNRKICQKVQNLMQQRIQCVYNRNDVIQSNYVFESINNKSKQNLHYLLNNQVEYEKFLKKKQKQLDGFSPLISISNISRKKWRPDNKKPSYKKQEVKKQQRLLKQNKYIFNKKQNLLQKFSNPQRERPLTSKWCKQGLYKKKQYFI